jgi:K+-sensing histidine kinase KdpD
MLRWSPPPPNSLSAAARYGIAVLSVAVALALALLLRDFDLQVPLLLMAIGIAVWYGTTASGLLAIVLSMAGLACFFLPALHSFEMSAIHVSYLIVFTLFASVISCLNASRHNAEEGLRRALGELEKMAEHTVALRRTGSELQAVLDASPVGISLFSSDQTFNNCNPASSSHATGLNEVLLPNPMWPRHRQN